MSAALRWISCDQEDAAAVEQAFHMEGKMNAFKEKNVDLYLMVCGHADSFGFILGDF